MKIIRNLVAVAHLALVLYGIVLILNVLFAWVLIGFRFLINKFHFKTA